MATLTVQEIVIGGLNPSFAAAAAAGDEFQNDGKTYFEVVNSHASNAYTLTFTTPASVKGVAIADPTVSVPAGVGTRRKVGPFPVDLFNNSNGRVQVAYTGTAPATDLTVAAMKMSV